MEGIGINFKLLLAQLLNFLLFLFIFKKYMADPFVKFIKEERRKEKEREEAVKRAEELKEKEEEILRKAREKAVKEMDKIIAQAKEDAKKLREKLMKQIQEEAERERERLKEELEREKKEFEEKLKEEVYKLSLILVEKALDKYFDERKKREFTKHLLENLKEIRA